MIIVGIGFSLYMYLKLTSTVKIGNNPLIRIFNYLGPVLKKNRCLVLLVCHFKVDAAVVASICFNAKALILQFPIGRT